MKKYLVLILFLLGLLNFALIHEISSQAETDSSVQKQSNKESVGQKRFRKAVKSSGWIIPKGAVNENNRSKTETIDNISVTKKTLFVEVDTDFNLETFVARSDEEIEIFSRKCDVKTLFSYEIEGKVFAYQAELVPVEIQENRKVYAGAIISIFFVDNDGDGVFEERYSLLQISKIPEWVRNTKRTVIR